MSNILMQLNQNYVNNVLIPNLISVITQTELGGDTTLIGTFSLANGNSSYSFGLFQYDIANAPAARTFLQQIVT